MTIPLSAASRDIVLPHGSTPRLRVRLTSRNVRSGALIVRPTALEVVEWRIGPPNTPPKTTAPGGGLSLDPRTRVIEYPFSDADRDALPAGGHPHTITVINADGKRFRFLEGTIRAAGQS